MSLNKIFLNAQVYRLKLLFHCLILFTSRFSPTGRYRVRNLAAQRAIELALARGFEVVIATNPVFPQKAIFERLRWGGFANKKFNLITSYENMHFCKPKPQYYAEILSKLGRTPAECWMIGNDVEEDLVAAQLGTNS